MSSPPPTTYHRCQSCGARLPPGTLEELCPWCVGEDAPTGDSGGRVLGDCELFEEIGRGGMGVVWRGRQRGLDREVAVKTLPGGDLAGAEARARFHTEARATARLKHPNIVSIHEVGEADGMPYFVMELIGGRTLGATVAEKPVTARQAARWLRDAALAVRHAHENGVLHRDLKPSNILIEPGTDGGRPRVTDFGLAKMTDAEAGVTLSGSAAGSPSFMPPEQVRGGASTVAGDVYGLGAVLYHAVTGRPPFQGESIAAVLAQVERDEPLSPRRLSPTVPPDLETICLKCLEKNPARRYASAGELAEDLTRFLEGLPVLARPLGRLSKVLRLARRNPWQAAAAGSIAVLILAGFSFMAWKTGTERRHQAALRAEQAVTKRALMRSQLGEARSIIRLRQPDSRPRALEMARLLSEGSVPPEIVAGARDVALAALALPVAHTTPLLGEGVVSDDWTMAAADLPRRRWALSTFRGPVALRPLEAAENTLTFPVGGRGVTALIRFSPGGRWLAIRHAEELGVWDTAPDAAERLAFLAQPWADAPFNFMKLAFTPDDRAVLWADRDAVVATALPGGAEIARWRGGSGGSLAVNALAFDLDGTCVALAISGEPVVEVRAWPDGSLLHRITGLRREATAVALTRHAGRVAAADADGHVSVWQAPRAGNRRSDFAGHAEALRGLAFDAAGRVLISTSDDGTLRAWDCLTDRSLVQLPFDMGVPAIAADGVLLGVGFADGRLSMAHLEPSQGLHRFRPAAPPENPQQISFAFDGQSLCCLTADGIARHTVPGGRELETHPFSGPYSLLAPSAVGGDGWVGGDSGLARIPAADSPGGTPDSGTTPGKRIFPPSRWGWSSLCATPDGRWLAASESDGARAVVLEAARPAASAARIFPTPGLGTGALALAPDGLRLAVGFRYDPGLQVFDVASQAVLRKLDLPPRHNLDWSPDGRWLAANGSTAALWETRAWHSAALPALDANHPPNGGCAFAPPDSSGTCLLMAMVAGNTRISLLSLPDHRLLATLEAPEGRPIYQLQFSRDRRWLAAATAGGEVQLWDLPALRESLAALGLDW